VNKALAYAYDPAVKAIKQPARQLCFELLLYEKGHRKALAGRIEEIFQQMLYNLLCEWLNNPLIIGEEAAGERAFSVPVHMLYDDVAKFIDGFAGSVPQKCLPPDAKPFSRLIANFQRNLLVASGVDPDRWEESGITQPVMAKQVKDKSPAALLDLYFGETPFIRFFNTPVTLSIPLKPRFSHMHVVAGSGHGKTQLLQSFILADLNKVREGKRSVIVMDSQGDLFNTIQHLAMVGEMADRVVIIDPYELDAPPALNLFDFGLERVKRYNAIEQEKLLNGAISLYGYIFGELLKAELTHRQELIFTSLACLLVAVPGATINTLRDFLREPQKVVPYIDKLEGSARDFFETDFFSKGFDETRQQIRNRLNGVLSKSRVLERMFSNKENKINIFDAMNRGSLILINTAKELLQQEGCAILGRFFIALICQAALERASIPDENRTPTFVYIDEAHDYFDMKMKSLLEQARKYYPYSDIYI
jgi:hypothetical protein